MLGEGSDGVLNPPFAVAAHIATLVKKRENLMVGLRVYRLEVRMVELRTPR